MMITIKLNPEQEKYFHIVKGSLGDSMPKGFATNNDVVNHCLMELLLFEEIRDDQVTNFLVDNNTNEYTTAINNPKRDFGNNFKVKKEEDPF